MMADTDEIWRMRPRAGMRRLEKDWHMAMGPKTLAS